MHFTFQEEELEQEEVDEKPISKKPRHAPSFHPPQRGAQVLAGMRSSASRGSLDPNAFGDFIKSSGTGNKILKMMEVWLF